MNQSLKRLVIDTATPYLYVAVLDNKEVVTSIYKEGKNDHSVTLMRTIDELFKTLKLKITDIDEIICGIGPGSYTGVRIGVTVCKMLGWSKNIPVKSISSLALLASSIDGFVIPFIDARRGNAFSALYKIENESIEVIQEDKLRDFDSFTKSIKDDWSLATKGEPRIEYIINSNLLKEVLNIHTLEPSYMRITEAERNK